MKLTRYFYALVFLMICVTSVAAAKTKPAQPWRAVHLLDYNTDAQLDALGANLETLAKQGINVIILEVDYNFTFQSHPELRRGKDPITRDGARRFAALCKKLNIRLIPEFQSVGHQSWKAETFPLLTVYPQFDLTPGAFPNNEGIYCREWDVLNPEVWRIVFALMDEIIDAFRADAMHVGMDEIFLLGSEKSLSTKGKDPGFRVLPAGWKNVDATKALIQFSRLHAGPKLLGYLFTTWGVNKDALVEFPPLIEGLKLLRDDRRPS